MEHGTELFIKGWRWRRLSQCILGFRYREDPVPCVWRYGRGRHYYRHPRTTQERRNPYPTRAKRNKNNLPSCWDGRVIPRPKSWKDCTRKRHQWQ